jgi:hypothetical protein
MGNSKLFIGLSTNQGKDLRSKGNQMLYTGITPIQKMGDIWVKREDLSHWHSLDFPSGSKVRQYSGMIERFNPQPTQPSLPVARRSTPQQSQPSQTTPYSNLCCLVGCSANSCQQIYVSAAAKIYGCKGIIYTAKRKVQTEATKYCLSLGAEVVEVKPAYLSYVRKKAHQRKIDEKHVIEWDSKGAILDAAKQVVALPAGVKHIIVPTGSGLTAAGVLKGLGCLYQASSAIGECPTLVIVATSPMANLLQIKKWAGVSNYPIQFIDPSTPYDTPIIAQLPDGTPLDPFYAAKAWKYVEPFDLLWPPGLRPVCSMPEDCRNEFKGWQGPT